MKNIEINEVYTFKLNSGEELVAKVLSFDEHTIQLGNPLSVAPNSQGIGLIPSMFTAERDINVELNTNSIAMYAPSADTIRVKYIEATTGITTASKKIVLG